MVVFGGYDHYRPTMTHLLHGLLEERHNGRVTLSVRDPERWVLGEDHGCATVTLGDVLGCATVLLGRVGVRRVRGTK